MLAEARTPVRAEAIDVGHIELRCASISEIDLAGRRFDLIYSIGVLGEYAPLTPPLCRKLLTMLEPEGRLFFTVVDTHSRLDREKCGPRVFVGLGGRVFRHAPNWLRRGMNQGVSSFYMTKAQIQKCLTEGGAGAYEISIYQHPPGSGWQGTHYECLLRSVRPLPAHS
jgi:2-polyprenyl-3-methyl-5-hydroxy-6-metoxy-1,4-benzoquinol methylase